MTDEEVEPAALRGTAGRARRLVTAGQFGLGVRTWQALLAITVVALLARLVGLGARPMHFDEARVAYWALRYAETGQFEYRYIIHGPFVQHVTRWLFPVLGTNDYVARLPVALVGGLLPLSVVLYRDHLRETELVALAALLSGNAVLLYYSRFMRSDVLVAAFMFVALGFLLRLHATRKARYLHAATVFVALGFASKENAVVYLLAWAGAGALLLDTALFRPRSGESGLARLTGGARRLTADHDRAAALASLWAGNALLAVLLFLALTLFFFAPRAGGAGGLGLWKTLARPAMVPDLLRETAWDVGRGLGYWFSGAVETRCGKEAWPAGYACFQRRYLATMLRFGGPLTLLAVGGFLLERYAVAPSRNLVMFAGYWGVASVVGYPLGMDIWAAWPTIHAFVPLAVPAAVAGGAVLRSGADALDERDTVDVAVSGLLVVLLVGYSGAVAVEASYLDARDRDGETDMVQYAQPSSDLRPGVRAMQGAAAANDGLDVLYYGHRYDLADESVMDRPPVPWNETDGWFDRLPLPWYAAAADATVASAATEAALERSLERDPAVVVAPVRKADAVAERVDGYERYGAYDLRAHLDGDGTATTVVIFVRKDT